MSVSQTKTAFGRIFPPRDAWLAKVSPEPSIDPDLPIIDTHHHLWHRTSGARGESWEVPAFRYLQDEFLADCVTGHNVGQRFSSVPLDVPRLRRHCRCGR